VESTSAHVQEVVKAAEEDLRQLMQQRADIVKRISTIKQTIVGLANMAGPGAVGIGRPERRSTAAGIDQVLPHGADGG
jgi:hypothetical protein